MNKKEAFEIVYNELIKNPLFCGKFDARHGSRQFMHGIYTVMENIVCDISEDAYEEYSTIWCNNFAESVERGEE